MHELAGVSEGRTMEGVCVCVCVCGCVEVGEMP